MTQEKAGVVGAIGGAAVGAGAVKAFGGSDKQAVLGGLGGAFAGHEYGKKNLGDPKIVKVRRGDQ